MGDFPLKRLRNTALGQDQDKTLTRKAKTKTKTLSLKTKTKTKTLIQKTDNHLSALTVKIEKY